MKLQSVLYYYFLDLLKAGGKKNTAAFSEYSHINQLVRPGGNYFWEYKRKFIYYSMKVSFVFHRMQPKQNLEVSRLFLFFSIIGYSLIIAKR